MDNPKKKQNLTVILVIVGIALVCTAVVCLLLFLMQGETTITENDDGEQTAEKIICKSQEVSYPLFDYDNSDSKSMEVTATFRDDKLDSISLIYRLYYSDAKQIESSESINHAALNISSQGAGLGPDAYNAKYSKLKDSLQLSLYAEKDDINNKALPYFMLTKINVAPYTQDKVAKAYANQGFDCESYKQQGNN